MRSVIAILCFLIFSTCVEATTTNASMGNEVAPEAASDKEIQKIKLIIPEKLFKEIQVSAQENNRSLGDEIIACLEYFNPQKFDVEGSVLSNADMKTIRDAAYGSIYEELFYYANHNYMMRKSWLDNLNTENKEYKKWLSAKTKNEDSRAIKSRYEDTTVVESTDKKDMVKIHFVISKKLLKDLKDSAAENNRSLKDEMVGSLDFFFPDDSDTEGDILEGGDYKIFDTAIVTRADKLTREIRFSSAASRERSLKYLNKLNQQFKESEKQ